MRELRYHMPYNAAKKKKKKKTTQQQQAREELYETTL